MKPTANETIRAYESVGFVKQPDGSWSKPKRVAVDPGKSSVAESSAEHGASRPTKTEAQSSTKFLVRITDVRRRLLDSDNLIGKFHTDCCRYSGLLPSDAPGQTTIEVGQRKLNPGEFQHTEILILELRGASAT